jgi:hypothetical protein
MIRRRTGLFDHLLKQKKMPKQHGFLKLNGTYDDVTFVKTPDGFIAKRKSSISAQRIKTDKKFQRTRENNTEFTKAAKAGKLLRRSLQPVIGDAKDRLVTSRLVTQMLAIVKSDTGGLRGSRTAKNGNIAMLEKFDFNLNVPLDMSFKVQVATQIDRAAGKLSVSIPEFIPKNSVSVPDGATHFKLVSAAAELDFDNEKYSVSTVYTDYLPLDMNAVAAQTLSTTAAPASTKALVLVMGIQFFQLTNGEQYPLQSGTFNAFSVLQATNA